MENIDCNSCKHITLTEEEQDKIKHIKNGEFPNHYCDLHRERLIHGGQHPRIRPCAECNGKDYIVEESEETKSE